MISVMKKRSGRHEESIRELIIDGKDVRLSEPLTNFPGVLSGTTVQSNNPIDPKKE